MTRRVVPILLCLILGAVSSFAVAWGAWWWRMRTIGQELEPEDVTLIGAGNEYSVTCVQRLGAAKLTGRVKRPVISDTEMSAESRDQRPSTGRALRVGGGPDLPNWVCGRVLAIDAGPDNMTDFTVERYGWPCLALEESRTFDWTEPHRYEFAGTWTVEWKRIPGLAHYFGWATIPVGLLPTGFVADAALFGGCWWAGLVGLRAARRRRRLSRWLCPECASPIGTSPVCTECARPLEPRSGAFQ